MQEEAHREEKAKIRRGQFPLVFWIVNDFYNIWSTVICPGRRRGRWGRRRRRCGRLPLRHCDSQMTLGITILQRRKTALPEASNRPSGKINVALCTPSRDCISSAKGWAPQWRGEEFVPHCWKDWNGRFRCQFQTRRQHEMLLGTLLSSATTLRHCYYFGLYGMFYMWSVETSQ